MIKKDQIQEISFEEIDPKQVESIPDQDPIDYLDPVSTKREDTRGRLAMFFLAGFFLILSLGIVLAGFSDGDKVTDAREILLTISGILSGPLGFVIGYYFRSSEE